MFSAILRRLFISAKLIVICSILATLFSGVQGVSAQSQALLQPADPQATQTLSFNPFDLYGVTTASPDPMPWYSTKTVVDQAGGMHTAFYTSKQIYYAYCPSNCGRPAGWLLVPLAGTGRIDSLDYPIVALTSGGHPRMMWWYQDDTSGNNALAYAECNSDCTDSANWTVIAAIDNANGSAQNTGYFALNNEDLPRVVEKGYNGFWWEGCSGTGDCTKTTNWVWYQIDVGVTIDEPWLVLTKTGTPRVVGRTLTGDLVYMKCNENCHSSDNWSSVVVDSGVSNFALRLDNLDRPRLAYYKNGNNDKLYYAGNNGNEIISGDWFIYTLPFTPNGDASFDLALDNQGHPHVSFGSDQYALRYAECTAQCDDTKVAGWNVQDVETSSELNSRDPISADTGCVVSTWLIDGHPSLGLDAAGNPSVSYYARHTQTCPNGHGGNSTRNDAWTIRITSSGGGSGGKYRISLPSILKH